MVLKKKTWSIVFLMGSLFIFNACESNEEKIEENNVQEQQTKEETTEVVTETSDKEIEPKETDITEETAEEKIEVESNSKEKNEERNENKTTTESSVTEKTDLKSLRDDYLQKLKDTDEQMKQQQKQAEEHTTIGMEAEAARIYHTWDNLLNEIYATLEEHLPMLEMDELRVEQREWIKYRDETAKEASSMHEGGTAEVLAYVYTQTEITRERCFELVEQYMK